MKFRWRRLIQFRARTLLLVLVLAAVGLGMYRKTQLVPVASTDIPVGTLIDRSMVSSQHRFHLLAPKDTYFDIGADGHQVAARRPIKAGEVFTRSKVTKPGISGITSLPLAYSRAFSIPFLVESLSGEISWSKSKPIVDVQFLLSGEDTSVTLLRRIKVLAIGLPFDQHGSAYCRVTFHVTPHQALQLHLASTQGQLMLVACN